MTDEFVPQALLGFCHGPDGVAFISADWGAIDDWLAAPRTFQRVRVIGHYFPCANVNRYPARRPVLGGGWATLPAPEAEALIAAGAAAAA